MPSSVAPEDWDTSYENMSYEDKKILCARVPFYWKDSIIQKARIYILKNSWNLDDIDSQPVVSSIAKNVIRDRLGNAKLSDEDIIARIVAVLEVTDNRVPMSWRCRLFDLPPKHRKRWLRSFIMDPSRSSLLRQHMKPYLLEEWAAKAAARANGQVLESPEAARWREMVRQRLREQREQREQEAQQSVENENSDTSTEEDDGNEDEGSARDSETDYGEIEAKITSMQAGAFKKFLDQQLNATKAGRNAIERTGTEIERWISLEPAQKKQQATIDEDKVETRTF